MSEDNGITSDLVNEIVNYIKITNSLDKTYDTLLELYVKSICTNILIRTNRRKFVEDLKYVVVDMVADKFNANKSDNALQSVQSMTEYDRSVNFGVSDITKAKINAIAKKQLDDNDRLINRFRLLYKI